MKVKLKVRNTVFPDHLKDLKKSGICEDYALSVGIYSAKRSRITKLLGYPPHSQVKSALVFTYGKDCYRLKVFPSYTDSKGRVVKYLQPKNTNSHFYIPPQSRGSLRVEKEPLVILEGEKKTHSASLKGVRNAIGLPGVWNWSTDRMPFDDFEIIKWRNRGVIYIPDSDVWRTEKNQSLKAVYAFCREMEERGAEVKVLVLSEKSTNKKNGIDDYLLQHTLDDLWKLPKIDLSDEAFLGLEDWYVARKNKSIKLNKKHNAHNALIYPSPTSAKHWPTSLPLHKYYGLAGDFVRLVDPATEADPMALYTQFLTVFGNIIGRSAHSIAEKDQHRMNLFVVLVGETSKGRKGSSWSQVRDVFNSLRNNPLQDRMSSGLSSGEGLIWAVRDKIEKTIPLKKKGKIIGYQNMKVDPGVQDKRLIIYEPEFASTLRVLEREGNILSTQIRQAWENGTLRTLTKNNPAQATDAHISIIGHITRDELRRYLNRTEAASGFGNRFLWICVQRSKSLPEGGSVDPLKKVSLMSRLDAALRYAATVGLMKRSGKARAYWRSIYDDLSEGKPGMAGTIVARAEAQVTRLSCLFALLDQSCVVRAIHLKAAVDVWKYAETSARHIFGKSIGDDIADRIYFELVNQPEGLSLSELSAIFSNHKGKTRIHESIQALLSLELVCWEEIRTGGRTKKIIKAISK